MLCWNNHNNKPHRIQTHKIISKVAVCFNRIDVINHSMTSEFLLFVAFGVLHPRSNVLSKLEG